MPRIMMPSPNVASKPASSAPASNAANKLSPSSPPEQDPNAIHPKLDRMRKELGATLDWVSKMMLQTFGESDETKKIAAKLKEIPSLPSEQVMPTLKRVSDEIQKAKVTAIKTTRKGDPSNYGGIKLAKRDYDDLQMAMQTAFKSASQISSSSRSDIGLYRNKIKGYTDKDGNFHATGSEIVPQESFNRFLKQMKLFSEGKIRDMPIVPKMK